MKLDIKTLFVGLAICFSYGYLNTTNNSDVNKLVNNLSEPSIKIVSLTR